MIQNYEDKNRNTNFELCLHLGYHNLVVLTADFYLNCCFAGKPSKISFMSAIVNKVAVVQSRHSDGKAGKMKSVKRGEGLE